MELCWHVCAAFTCSLFAGTHDSMSYGISKTSGISPDSTAVVKVLGKFLGPLVKPIVLKWCVTQRSAMEEQLISGIRCVSPCNCYFSINILPTI